MLSGGMKFTEKFRADRHCIAYIKIEMGHVKKKSMKVFSRCSEAS